MKANFIMRMFWRPNEALHCYLGGAANACYISVATKEVEPMSGFPRFECMSRRQPAGRRLQLLARLSPIMTINHVIIRNITSRHIGVNGPAPLRKSVCVNIAGAKGKGEHESCISNLITSSTRTICRSTCRRERSNNPI